MKIFTQRFLSNTTRWHFPNNFVTDFYKSALKLKQKCHQAILFTWYKFTFLISVSISCFSCTPCHQVWKLWVVGRDQMEWSNVGWHAVVMATAMPVVFPKFMVMPLPTSPMKGRTLSWCFRQPGESWWPFVRVWFLIKVPCYNFVHHAISSTWAGLSLWTDHPFLSLKNELIQPF